MSSALESANPDQLPADPEAIGPSGAQSANGAATPMNGESPSRATPFTFPAPPPPPRVQQQQPTFFGLPQNTTLPTGPQLVFNDDYEKRLPEDAYCEETAPNARVWRVYVEEAAELDRIMVGQSREGLDVMLVFAGLFSAIVTSFLVQVSQNLQANFTEMSAILLYDLVSVQLAMSEGGSMLNITAPTVNPSSTFEPAALDVWVNGLWSVSLTASLVVALTAVLVKQWLHHYASLPSGTPMLRSHTRQYRYMGLKRWHVSVIVGAHQEMPYSIQVLSS